VGDRTRPPAEQPPRSPLPEVPGSGFRPEDLPAALRPSRRRPAPRPGAPRPSRRRVRLDPRRLLGGLGRLLVACGLLILAFVAYQLWGTGLSEASSQGALRQQFDREAAGLAHPSPSPTAPAPPVPAPATAAPADGQPVGIIQIPKIGVDKVVVEGTSVEDLRKGPGHYPGTPLPGQPGNSAIAGHRTTYGAPFYNLDQLVPGDPIYLVTLQGRFRYQVVRTLVVSPSDVSVAGPTSANQLTLTTCNPRYSAAQRLVVQAVLTGAPAPPSPQAPPSRRPGRPGPTGSLAGEAGDWTPALWWGLGLLGSLAAVAALGRATHRPALRWAAYLAGGAGVAAVLFFFFENVSPLLPASF
jgi:sortase A